MEKLNIFTKTFKQNIVFNPQNVYLKQSNKNYYANLIL